MPQRAPKDAGQRRRYNQPALGEWVDLPASLEEPILEPYPAAWRRRDKRETVIPKWIWDYWRRDPVTSQWSPGDHAQALELGASFQTLTPEFRFRIQTSLGLNATGRRALRWRNRAETESAVKANQQAAEARRLRIVVEKGAA